MTTKLSSKQRQSFETTNKILQYIIRNGNEVKFSMPQLAKVMGLKYWVLNECCHKLERAKKITINSSDKTMAATEDSDLLTPEEYAKVCNYRVKKDTTKTKEGLQGALDKTFTATLEKIDSNEIFISGSPSAIADLLRLLAKDSIVDLLKLLPKN